MCKGVSSRARAKKPVEAGGRFVPQLFCAVCPWSWDEEMSNIPVKSTSRLRNEVSLFAVLICSLLFNVAWQTGFTFSFSETPLWPNYNMLSKAFYRGQVSIDDTPQEDYLDYNGRKYLYYGPLPALLRLPLLVALPHGVPTGFMVALFCAGCAYLFAGCWRR